MYVTTDRVRSTGKLKVGLSSGFPEGCRIDCHMMATVGHDGRDIVVTTRRT